MGQLEDPNVMLLSDVRLRVVEAVYLDPLNLSLRVSEAYGTSFWDLRIDLVDVSDQHISKAQTKANPSWNAP